MTLLSPWNFLEVISIRHFRFPQNKDEKIGKIIQIIIK
jgi:hypothetical protein